MAKSKPTVQEAMAVKRAVESFVRNSEGVKRVEFVLAAEGPEVRVIVAKARMKHFRLLLPAEKHGVPIIVQIG